MELLTQSQIEHVSIGTVDQRESTLWHSLRSERLTASNFGLVLSAVKRNSYPPSLFKRLLGMYGNKGDRGGKEIPPALKHGVDNEHIAISMYESTTGNKVEKVGLILADISIIGCSPDGYVSDNVLLEVKCPYTHRQSTVIKAATNDPHFCLHVSNSTLQMKKTHDYYAQVQGSLYITKRATCHFVVWLENDFVIVNVSYDDDWCKENIPKLINFFHTQFKP
jgi:hypothetical protein